MRVMIPSDRPQPFAIFGRWVSRSATFDLNENYLKSVAAL